MPSPATHLQRFRILEALELLDASPDPSLDRFVRVAAHAARVPMALVTFLAPARQVNKARLGLDDPYTPLADAFCVCALDDPGLLEVPDALQDERFATSALVAGPTGVRSYAGQPIVFDGVVLGTVCVMDRVARRLEPAQREVLAELGGLASDLLSLRHEQRLRRLQEQRACDCAAAAGEWLWETDEEGRVTWLAGRLDDEVAVLAGDRLGAPMIDREVLDGLGRSRVPPVTLGQLVAQRAPFTGAVSRLDGGTPARLVERNASPFDDAGGRFGGFRGSCREVTDRVRAEVMALDTDAARRASQSKSEFLSRVSHELRTPLNAMLGFTQLMLMDGSDADAPTPVQRQRLDVMLQAGQRLLALINDMLDLARIEQGRLDIALEAIDVHGAVQSSELLLRPLCAERAVTLRNLVQPDESTVWADRRALAQVLLNLLSNAVKYNRPGGLVTVRAETGDPAGIVIEDNGLGMTEAQLASLYQPFNRLGAEGGPVAGSGLGLVICQALVERMHGQLEIGSLAGVGTTARVRLPRPRELAAGPAREPDRAPSPCEAGTADAAQKRTVLYAEDNTVNAMLMEELFAEEPCWRLIVATTGRAAIDVALTTEFDLVLVDMHLTDMTGLELLWSLRDRGVRPRKGFVAVSADAFPEQVRAAQDTGFGEYWTKPLDLRKTWDRLRQLLG